MGSQSEGAGGFEQRIGARRAVHGVTMLLPDVSDRLLPGGQPVLEAVGASKERRTMLRRTVPIEATVANLSMTGAGIVAPKHPMLGVGAHHRAVLDGVPGIVRIRVVTPGNPDEYQYGVSFVGHELVPAAGRVLEMSGAHGQMADALVRLLDELAGWIERTATWSDEQLTLHRLAWDLSRTVDRLEEGNVGVREIISSVCWIDASPAGVADLANLDHWTRDASEELARHPFAARQDLARALIVLAGDQSVSPFGMQVLKALADSLL
jgi:hypothetical protein